MNEARVRDMSVKVTNTNKVTDAIERHNQDALVAIQKFRANLAAGAADWADFSRLKHEHPYIGFAACRARGIDFALFSANDDQVAWEYQWFGPNAYEPKIVRTWVRWCRRHPGLVYDIGGYTGVMSILAAKANRENRVHLFEPMARTIERAKINVRANGLAQRVQLHNKAASDQAGQAQINLYREENFLGSGNSIFDKSLPIRDVKVIDRVRIDDELPDGSPLQVKIDVEGHELEVLRGLTKTIERSRPRLIVETWQHTRAEVLDTLDDWGYRCVPFEDKQAGVINFKCVPV
jgi:FkbM family methyltransferase